MKRIWREMRDRGRFLSSREWELGTRACRPRRLVLEPLETRTLLDGAGIVGGSLFDDLDRSGGRDPGEPPLVDWTVELQRVGSTNVPEVTFANPSPDDWSQFGRFVASAGANVLVGSHYDDVSGYADAGAAYLFDGITGELLHVLNSPTPAAGEEFGFAVAALGDDILVGARWDNREDSAGNANGGAVYLFDGATGELLQTIANPAPTAWDAFGVSVATLGDQVLVGSQFGNAAYTFQALPDVSTTSTDGQGNFRFAQVEAGTYRVVQQLADGYVPTYPGDPGTYTAIIEDDDTILDLDFGNAADQIPQADSDDYEVTEDHLLAVSAAEGALVNDHDADDDPLTAVLVNAPPYGTLLLKADGAVTFGLDGPALLDPGGYTLLVKGRTAFEARYGGGLPVLGEYQGDLDNSAAQILLTDPFDQVIVDFRYGDRDDWPRWTDGFGSTLEVLDVDGPYGDGGNWRASSQYGGSPGAESSPPPEIVVNELLTHANLPATDAIELLNRSDLAIDIGGWYLSDSANNLRKYHIPTGTVIPAGGYLVFGEHDFNPGRWEPGAGGFALNSALGEDVWLTAADEEGHLTWFVDHVEFGAALNGESFGRWRDATGSLYPMTELTLPGQNSGPRVGPIIISEVMYNPPTLNGTEPAGLEFIEIYNPTNEVLDTPNWHVRGGVEHDFPTRHGFPIPADIPGRVTVDPGATVVLVGFDPADPAAAETVTDFRRYYAIDETVQLAGPFTGSLNNAGDVVRLLRPDHPPPWEPHYWPHVVEDELVYDDVTPWPTEPDGQGASLHRRRADLWGHDPASWVAGLPTPGSVDLRLGNLAVSELNYNPYAPTDAELAVDPELDNDDFEFIELLNFGAETIDLDGVQLVDGVLFDFPAMPLAPNQRIVVAKDLAAFQIRYGTEITALGEYLGGLKNAGEHVMFASAAYGPIFDFTYADVDPWPVRADGNGGEMVQLRRADGVLEDEVTYSDRAPWPVRPDGQGDSLHRLGTDLWGNDPAIWTTAAPTPGTAPLLAAPASGDLNGDGQVNGLDVDLLVGVLVGEPYNGVADMNQDGAVNGLDVDPFVTAILGADGQPGVALGAASMSPTTERFSTRLLRARHVHDGDDLSQLIHHRRVEQVFARRVPLGRDGHRSPQEDMVHQVAGDWQVTVEHALGDQTNWIG